jgi:hypothetical protein
LSDNDVPSPDQVAAVFDFAGLTVPPDRLQANYETYSSTLALIRQVSSTVLGETVPAVGFNAGWD